MKKDVLLNYVMPVEVVAPTPAADTSYLRKMLVVVKPKGEQAEEIVECTTQADVEQLTDAKVARALAAGLVSVFVLPTDNLANVGAKLAASKLACYTLAVDAAFDDLATLDVGTFDGVVAWATADKEKAKAFAIEKNNVAFFVKAENGGASMYRAFGALLSANTWTNQQYLGDFDDEGIVDIAEAEELFAARVSFVLTSKEYGSRLALFASNKRAIVAPYLFEEIQVRLQSTALRYISLNRPQYTVAEASKVEDTLQEVLNTKYIVQGVIESGEVTVAAIEDNFQLNATIAVAEPSALWRIRAVLIEGGV